MRPASGAGARRTSAPAVIVSLTLAFAVGTASATEVHSDSGPVSATLRIEPTKSRIGDALRLDLEVVAEAGVELLMPEFGEALDRFAVVDFAPSAEVDDDGRTIERQRYTLQASRSGPQSIPPLLIEFIDRRPGRSPAPSGSDAFELLTPRLEFEVETVLTSDDSLELRKPLGRLGPQETPGPARWPWLLACGLVLATVSPFALRAYRTRRALRLRRSAYDVANTALEALLCGRRPSGDDREAVDAFYVELSGIVRRYLESRFGLHSPEQTTEEFLDALVLSPELGRSHRELLRNFLSGADLVKFAHYTPDESAIGASIESARRFLEETREVSGA